MHPHETQTYTLKDFLPLIIIVLVIVAFTIAAMFVTGMSDSMFAMQMFMAGFFLVFGFFKVLNLKGFVNAYQEYDIVARQSRLYGYVYPFIELALGIAYLVGWNLFVTNWVTLVVMSVSAIGVLQKLLEKETIPCACLGVVFKIPMTWVTFGEDMLMALMAALMLLNMSGGVVLESPVIEATINDTNVVLEVVATPELRRQGLSGRDELPEGTGMLFVFEKPGAHGIWMKDMHFPIDIVWLDQEKKVTHVVEYATPGSFPTVFRPDTSALYVIEVPAGFVDEHGIAVGASVAFADL